MAPEWLTIKQSGSQKYFTKERTTDNEHAQGAPLDLRHPILISPQEPQVTLTMGDKLIDFLIHLRMEHTLW